MAGGPESLLMSFTDSVRDINVTHRKILCFNLMEKFEAKGYGASRKAYTEHVPTI